jgi:hypothetical protein
LQRPVVVQNSLLSPEKNWFETPGWYGISHRTSPCYVRQALTCDDWEHWCLRSLAAHRWLEVGFWIIGHHRQRE